jgi:oligoendopeptidase F
MKRVLITSIYEDSVDQDHFIGDVTENEYLQLRALVGTSVHQRQKRVEKYPVLRRIYDYRREDDGPYYEYNYDEAAETAFQRVEELDVSKHLCYHIIWHAGG